MSNIASLIETKVDSQGTFNLSHGARAPAYRRLRFEDLVESYVHDDRMSFDAHRELWTLSGILWNCRARLPRHCVSDFEWTLHAFEVVPKTYAQAARFIRWRMTVEKPRIRVQAGRSSVRN